MRANKKGEQPSYGLTHKPKDLMHDPSHFFIWLFYDENETEHFIILSVSDFINLMGEKFFKSMSWRKGNCRIHFSKKIENKLGNYLNKWDNLIYGGKINTNVMCINAQEANKSWNSTSKEVIEKWKKTNQEVISKIPPGILKRIKRKTEVGE